MSKKSFDDVMNMLKEVPGVNDHLNKFSVMMGKQILKRRFALGLTQQEVVQLVRSKGHTFSQSRLSMIETGDSNIESDTYDKVFEALGGLEDIETKFKEYPIGGN